MTKVYEINIRSLYELVTTHYAINFGTSTMTSADKIYKDPEEFVALGNILEDLLAYGNIKPFPYSDLQLENDILYYPVSEGSSKIRFGSTLYDLKEGVFTVDISRAATQSLIVMDYSKYLGHSMTAEEKDDLAFILNIYRTGRSPLLELDVFTKASADGVDLLAHIRRNVSPEDTQAYNDQISRIASMWSTNSKILPGQSLQVPQSGKTKVAPLLTILAEFLNQSGFSTGSISMTPANAEYDEVLYNEWVDEVLQPIGPTQISYAMTSFLPKFIYVFQFLATHPGMINKAIENGSLSTVVNGKSDDTATPGIYQGRNLKLLELVNGIYSNDYDPEDLPANIASNSLDPDIQQSAGVHFSNQVSVDALVSSRSSTYKNPKSYRDDIKSAVEGYGNGSMAVIDDDMLHTFAIANSGLVPLEHLFDGSGNLNTSKDRPGLGLSVLGRGYSSTFSGRSDSLTADAQQLVKFEEETLRGADYLRVTRGIAGDPVDNVDLRDMSLYTITDTGWARQSTSNNFEKSYLDSRMVAGHVGWHNTFHYISVVNGKDIGGINPLSRTSVSGSMSASDNSVRMASLIKLAQESGSKSKGSWFKVDFDTVKATRVALQRVLQRVESQSR